VVGHGRDGVRCIEAQVMDLSDDIAYSVHDFEDAVTGGYIDVSALSGRRDHDDLVTAMYAWIGGEYDHAELIGAFDRLEAQGFWITSWDASRRDQGRLKNLTSQLIGRFAGAATRATRAAYPGTALSRFSANVVVPPEIGAEIAVLKGIVAAFVMTSTTRTPVYTQQRELLQQLADVLVARPEALDPAFAADHAEAADDAGRRRAVVDQVASLTDQSAIAWHERLVH
jgi:dGTPase